MYFERLRLNDRVAVVTGGTQGIGLSISEALAEAGARVVALSNSPQQIDAATATLKGLGYEAYAHLLDVTDSRAVNDVADMIEKTYGPVDILVNNAGIAPATGGAEDVNDELFDVVIDVNLAGMFRCCRAFGRKMLSRRRGAIVNMGSISGVINNTPQDQSCYNISKAGVHHLTRCLAAEWAPDGIRVNCVAPTIIETPLTKSTLVNDPKMTKAWLNMTPMGRVGQPHEVASVVHFLASDASSLMTGAVVMADAGYTLW
ncbi:MAG: SDR family oxidoreductase [Alphaproteobacteria bacterium]|nr:SDR family oxidoreductase [Alphaproteobacteria bacterium]